MKLWGNCVPVSKATVFTVSPALNRWEHRHLDSGRCSSYDRIADFLINTQSARDTFTLSEAKLSHRGPTLVPVSLGAPRSCPTISRCPSALDAALLPKDQRCCGNNRKQERKHTLSLDSKNGVTHAHNLLVLNRKGVFFVKIISFRYVYRPCEYVRESCSTDKYKVVFVCVWWIWIKVLSLTKLPSSKTETWLLLSSRTYKYRRPLPIYGGHCRHCSRSQLIVTALTI